MPFNAKPTERAIIGHYLPSQAEEIIEDLIETLKHTYNTAWTTGFLKTNKNEEFKPTLKTKEFNHMHFPASLRSQFKIHLTNTLHKLREYLLSQ